MRLDHRFIFSLLVALLFGVPTEPLNLFRVCEMIRADVGGEAQIVQRRFATKKQINRFTNSLDNPALRPGSRERSLEKGVCAGSLGQRNHRAGAAGAAAGQPRPDRPGVECRLDDPCG